MEWRRSKWKNHSWWTIANSIALKRYNKEEMRWKMQAHVPHQFFLISYLHTQTTIHTKNSNLKMYLLHLFLNLTSFKLRNEKFPCILHNLTLGHEKPQRTPYFQHMFKNWFHKKKKKNCFSYAYQMLKKKKFFLDRFCPKLL